MKKLIALFLCFSCAAFPACAWDIVKDGHVQAVIVIPEKPYPAETYAAAELQYILKKATGAELKTVTPSAIPAGMKTIRLGRIAKLDLKDLPLSGFRVSATDDALLLAGRDTNGKIERLQTAAGTLYAVYEWAERELNVRWLWPDELGEEIPARPTVAAGSYDLVVKPALEFAFVRRFDWRWNRRLLRADMSRYIIFSGCPSQGHAFIDWYKRYGAEHPDYFEMDSQGRRLNDRYASMCVSNPAFQQQVIDNWQASGHTDQAVNAKENDAYGRCLCDNCKAWDGEDRRWPTVYYSSHRNVGERYAKFYKAIWEKASKINPDVRVGGYAYMNYVYAPRKTKLNKNIVIGFVDDLPFPRTKKYQQLVDDEIEAWGKSGASIYLRPNYYLSSYAMPELYYNQYAHEFKLACRNGMIGLDVDGPNNSWATIGLNLYVMSRLVVQPEKPVDELVGEYCAAFGKAAPAVRRYLEYWQKYTMDHADEFNRIHEEESERKWFIYGSYYTAVSHLLFPEKVFVPAAPFLDEAETLAKGDPIAEKRVQFLRQGYEHAKLCSRTSALFADPKNDNAVRQKAFAEVKQFRKSLLPNVADVEFFSSRKNRLEGNAWKLIDVDLSNAIALPEKWRVKADSAEGGRKLGYFKTDCDDKDWKMLSTWSFLEDQGLLEYRFAWYRTTVKIPAEYASRKVILRIGAIDESGWIWVNGKPAGELIYDRVLNPNSWRTAQEYDITDAVKFGQDNQITVLVENTVGKGGLWRPSYIRFEKSGTGEQIKPDLPARRGYAEKITGDDGTPILKISGCPERGQANAWATSVAPLPCQSPAGKTFRLKADVKAENLGKGQFWLVLREISATGQTLTYEGFQIRKDCDWSALEKDILIRKNAASIALFAVGLNMPDGATAMVKNVTVEEMK